MCDVGPRGKEASKLASLAANYPSGDPNVPPRMPVIPPVPFVARLLRFHVISFIFSACVMMGPLMEKTTNFYPYFAFSGQEINWLLI